MEPTTQDSPSKRGTVLVVDDDETLRTTLVACLESNGYASAGCADGKDALAFASTNLVSLAVVDIFMAGIDGFELIMRLRTTTPDLKIIAISGGGYESAAKVLRIATHFGAKHALEKPFAPTAFMAAVRELIGTAPVG